MTARERQTWSSPLTKNGFRSSLDRQGSPLRSHGHRYSEHTLRHLQSLMGPSHPIMAALCHHCSGTGAANPTPNRGKGNLTTSCNILCNHGRQHEHAGEAKKEEEEKITILEGQFQPSEQINACTAARIFKTPSNTCRVALPFATCDKSLQAVCMYIQG